MAGNKYLKNNAGTITEEAALQASTGASDAGAIPALDVTGRLDVTMMPVGIAADVAVVAASENLAAGDLVNIFNDTGTPKVRKADATTVGKEAHGFVQAGVTSGANATIYFEGTNANVTGQTAGPVFLSTTAGLSTSTAPSAAGNVVQRVGFAISSTAMNFQSNDPIVLA
jgi:hypothetical protein